MTEEENNAPYFALVNKEAPEGMAVGNIDRFANASWPMIDSLMREGNLVMQHHLFDSASALLFFLGATAPRDPIIAALKSHEIRVGLLE